MKNVPHVEIRDRVKELRRVRASDLLPNPKNWREHPAHQKRAMESMLRDIGFADALLGFEPRGAGKGVMLIDGHLRAELAPDTVVPVLILDVTVEEADQLLARLDPMSTLAVPNIEKLTSLLNGARPLELAAFLGEIKKPGEVTGKGTGRLPPPDDRVAKVVVRMEEAGLLERALLKTGLPDRGKALAVVCRAFLGEAEP
jgi:hypothetical protein